MSLYIIFLQQLKVVEYHFVALAHDIGVKQKQRAILFVPQFSHIENQYVCGLSLQDNQFIPNHQGHDQLVALKVQYPKTFTNCRHKGSSLLSLSLSPSLPLSLFLSVSLLFSQREQRLAMCHLLVKKSIIQPLRYIHLLPNFLDICLYLSSQKQIWQDLCCRKDSWIPQKNQENYIKKICLRISKKY